MSATVIDGLFPVEFRDSDPDRIGSAKVCHEAQITFRQLDFWARTYLIPGLDRKIAPGCGHQRSWTPEQLAFVVQLGRLVRAGITPSLASKALMAQTVDGVLPDRIDMGGGIVLVLESPTSLAEVSA